MASVWKHPNSPYWTACFTDLDGKRKKRSTKETNRRKAEKLAEQYEQAARKRRTFSQVRTVLQDLHREITGEDLKSVTVREHVKNWLAEKKDETKPATMQFYGTSTTKLLDFLGERADQEISLVTRGDLIGYRKTLASTLSSTSTNHHIKCARMLFKTARRDALIAENPAEFVERVKKKGGYERKPFTQEEIRRVLAQTDKEWRSMILFGLYSGQRLSDIAGFTWEQVNLEKAELRFETAKTGRRMIIPMAPPLLSNLKLLRKKENPASLPHREATALSQGRTKPAPGRAQQPEPNDHRTHPAGTTPKERSTLRHHPRLSIRTHLAPVHHWQLSSFANSTTTSRILTIDGYCLTKKLHT